MSVIAVVRTRGTSRPKAEPSPFPKDQEDYKYVQKLIQDNRDLLQERDMLKGKNAALESRIVHLTEELRRAKSARSKVSEEDENILIRVGYARGVMDTMRFILTDDAPFPSNYRL